MGERVIPFERGYEKVYCGRRVANGTERMMMSRNITRRILIL